MAGQAARISMSAMTDVRNIQARGVGCGRWLGRGGDAAHTLRPTWPLAHPLPQYAGVEMSRFNGETRLFPAQNYSGEGLACNTADVRCAAGHAAAEPAVGVRDRQRIS